MMMVPLRGPEPGRVLAGALLRLLPGAHILEQDRTAWASATFTGIQHRLVLCCPNVMAASTLACGIDEADFSLRGHLLADICATIDADRLTIEALTLVEA